MRKYLTPREIEGQSEVMREKLCKLLYEGKTVMDMARESGVNYRILGGFINNDRGTRFPNLLEIYRYLEGLEERA